MRGKQRDDELLIGHTPSRRDRRKLADEVDEINLLLVELEVFDRHVPGNTFAYSIWSKSGNSPLGLSLNKRLELLQCLSQLVRVAHAAHRGQSGGDQPSLARRVIDSPGIAEGLEQILGEVDAHYFLLLVNFPIDTFQHPLVDAADDSTDDVKNLVWISPHGRGEGGVGRDDAQILGRKRFAGSQREQPLGLTVDRQQAASHDGRFVEARQTGVILDVVQTQGRQRCLEIRTGRIRRGCEGQRRGRHRLDVDIHEI